MNRGLFLCIEDGDGTGKGTQHRMLADRLTQEGREILEVDFPQYGQRSAELIELYLNNEFGDATKLDARLASVIFAIDRLAAKDKTEQARAVGALVLANRFTASNMASQGAKIANRKDRVAFFDWLHSLEHGTMEIPEPDHYFVLHVPAAIARHRILQKSERSYTTKKLDGLEADLGYQKRAEQTYLDLVHTFPDKFSLVECVDGSYERTPEEIHEEIYTAVKERAHL